MNPKSNGNLTSTMPSPLILRCVETLDCLKYLLSKCFPRINPWIADRILELERLDRDRFVREFERATRRMRRDEGLLTAYDIKTKKYSEAEESERDTDFDTPILERQPLEQTCSICLLEFEEGEAVTDLTCRHLYHAECASEWLLKKNECPLVSAIHLYLLKVCKTN